MIDIYSTHDKMHKNRRFYALICINNNTISCINCMLSASSLGVMLHLVLTIYVAVYELLHEKFILLHIMYL